MLDWHPTPQRLGRATEGPFRFSREGTARRREGRAVTACATIACSGLFVLAGWLELGLVGAAMGLVAAGAMAWAFQRVLRAFFVRVVPALEVHEYGACFCDANRPLYFDELSGLMVGKDALFLAFKRGREARVEPEEGRVPQWERAMRKGAYWEIPLDGFEQPEAVTAALRKRSGLPVANLTEEVEAALKSGTAQAIARVPAASFDSPF